MLKAWRMARKSSGDTRSSRTEGPSPGHAGEAIPHLVRLNVVNLREILENADFDRLDAI
jgi:hypothetical protein